MTKSWDQCPRKEPKSPGRSAGTLPHDARSSPIHNSGRLSPLLPEHQIQHLQFRHVRQRIATTKLSNHNAPINAFEELTIHVPQRLVNFARPSCAVHASGWRQFQTDMLEDKRVYHWKRWIKRGYELTGKRDFQSTGR